MLVSHALHDITEPLLYESIPLHIGSSSRMPNLNWETKIHGLKMRLAADGGRFAACVRKCELCVFGDPTPEQGTLACDLMQMLTRVEDLKIWWRFDDPSIRILPSIRLPRLSVFRFAGDSFATSVQFEDFNAFLEFHSTIEHLEMPSIHSMITPSSEVLPKLKKLAVVDPDLLQNFIRYPISHLALTSSAEPGFEPDELSTVLYLTCLESVELSELAEFVRLVPNLRCLSYQTEGLSIESIRDELDGFEASSSLCYLHISSFLEDDDEDINSIIGDIFQAIPSLMIIDFYDVNESDTTTRLFKDGSQPPQVLPAPAYEDMWPTDDALERMLFKHTNISLVDVGIQKQE
ncbi:hypothetical protein ONZ45_g11073 [Pleurotus djamor]|nr:hypothetical protein ONZ45_g11073 [Pleurotus djamor]